MTETETLEDALDHAVAEVDNFYLFAFDEGHFPNPKGHTVGTCALCLAAMAAQEFIKKAALAVDVWG